MKKILIAILLILLASSIGNADWLSATWQRVDGTQTINGVLILNGTDTVNNYVPLQLNAYATATDQNVNSMESYLYLDGQGTISKFTGIKSNVSLRTNATGNYTITDTKDFTGVLNLGGTGRSHTLTNVHQYFASNTFVGSNAYTGTVWAGYVKGPFAISSGTPTFTVADMAGFYMTGAETLGVRNHGIWLAGDARGAGITLGANGDVTMYNDSDNGIAYLQNDISTPEQSPAGATKRWLFTQALHDDVNGAPNFRYSAAGFSISNCETTGDTFTSVGHSMEVGQKLINGSDTDCGLADSTTYYVCTVPTADTFTLVTTWANCPGTLVNVTETASRVVTGITLRPDAINLPDPASMARCTISTSAVTVDTAFYGIAATGDTVELQELGAGGKFEPTRTGGADDCDGEGAVVCVYDNGSNAVVLNDLGSTKTVMIECTYY
jgi:hypothetical protein